MKRIFGAILVMGIALLTLAACGSSAPEPAGDERLFAANGPALTVVEKQPDQYIADPGCKTTPPEQSPDLLTMNSQEEAGYALFYPLLNETQFRELMQRDGVDFIPDRVVRDEEGGIAYFSSCAGDIVYLAPDLTSVRLLSKQDRSGCVRDARWLDADRLLFLQGDEFGQAVYLFRPMEDVIELLYQSPAGREILGIEVDENGEPVCILSALPQLSSTAPAEDPATGDATDGETAEPGPALAPAKKNDSSPWDEDGELPEGPPTEKIELDAHSGS